MIISDEQASAAAHYLKTPCSSGRCSMHPEVSPAVLAAARAVVESTPEMRVERVADAMTHLHAGSPDSRQVATKMISRIISDSLR